MFSLELSNRGNGRIAFWIASPNLDCAGGIARNVIVGFGRGSRAWIHMTKAVKSVQAVWAVLVYILPRRGVGRVLS